MLNFEKDFLFKIYFVFFNVFLFLHIFTHFSHENWVCIFSGVSPNYCRLRISIYWLILPFFLPLYPVFFIFVPFPVSMKYHILYPKEGGWWGGTVIIYTTAQKFYKFCLQLFSELLFLGGQRCKDI